MRDGSIYILGAGSTTSRIADILGVEKTLLGVDVIQDGRLMIKDASERELLELLSREANVKIILSPIGAQGFILGRGNQQLSADVVRRVGTDNLIIVSTPTNWLRSLICLWIRVIWSWTVPWQAEGRW